MQQNAIIGYGFYFFTDESTCELFYLHTGFEYRNNSVSKTLLSTMICKSQQRCRRQFTLRFI